MDGCVVGRKAAISWASCRLPARQNFAYVALVCRALFCCPSPPPPLACRLFPQFGALFFFDQSTAKKFRFMCSQKRNCSASPNFHIHVSVSDLYIPTIGHLFSCIRISWPIVEILYIKRSQKLECRNWDCGGAVPFLGIFVSNFRYLCLCSGGLEKDGLVAQDRVRRTSFVSVYRRFSVGFSVMFILSWVPWGHRKICETGYRQGHLHFANK